MASALYNTHTPDELRGRVMGLYMLVFIGGNPVRQMVGFTSKGRLVAFIDEALQIAA